mgnify:CR=1 FL=1
MYTLEEIAINFVFKAFENKKRIKEDINLEFVIIDTNDLQIEILGKSNKNTNNNFLESLIWDNPFGQSTQQTPIVIARKIQ